MSLSIIDLLFAFSLLPLSFAAPGQLAIFLDEVCNDPSVINPSIHLASNICLVTQNVGSVAIQILPSCTSGGAKVILYEDTSCANQATKDTTMVSNNCYYFGLYGIPALLFACDNDAGGDTATSTSTITAGSSTLAVAQDTPIAASPMSSNTPGETTAIPSANNPSVIKSRPSSSNSLGPSPTSSDGSNGSTDTSGSGISHRTQIILAIALPTGALVIAILAWLFPFNGIKHFR
ncbi:MAG: hypothetical protein Q9190_000829 [Brigantiaea leucoxantha]